MKETALTAENARAVADQFLRTIPAYAGGFSGRGIVIPGGGMRYLPGAWVCIRLLRDLGCKLPIQLWHLGPNECDARMAALVRPFGVECVDGYEVRKRHPARILNGWEIKPYSILHCPFVEVLLLDADNVPVMNPEFLFETPQFRDAGAIFWPDYGRLDPTRPIWDLCGVPYQDEPEFETGQLVVRKERCWDALNLTMWYNEHSDFFYRYLHGDKETFHMAFRKLNTCYAMPATPICPLEDTMCQHDFEGRRVFQHRNLDKWSLFQPNKRIAGFVHEDQCRKYLVGLRRAWRGRIWDGPFDFGKMAEKEKELADILTCNVFDYHRVGYDRRPMTFSADGTVGEGAAGCEVFWGLKTEAGEVVLELAGEVELTCRLSTEDGTSWRGQWLDHERMPVELTRL